MKIAVIGAGIGGLVAGYRLAISGHDVTVFDGANRAGGVVGTTREAGFLCEHAASSFLGNKADGAAALCDELQVAMESASPLAKRRYIYIDGAKRCLPRSPVELLRSDLLTWRGKLDMLREPWLPPEVIRDEESVHAFVARRLGPEAARAIIAPAMTGIYAADAHDIGLLAAFPSLSELTLAGGITRGALRMVRNRLRDRALSAFRREHRERPPALKHKGLLAPVGGLGALVSALEAQLGDRLRLGKTVRSVAAAANGSVLRFADGSTHRCDVVVMALPAATSAPLVEHAHPELAARLSDWRRAPAAVVYLGYTDDAVPAARDGFGMLIARGESLRALGIVFESTVWSERAPSGQVLLRCIFAGARDPLAFEFDDDHLIAQAIKDVAIGLGASAAPIFKRVRRSRDGIAQYPVGHRVRVETAESLARRHRIVLAGADYHGVSLNDLCADGARIVREIDAR